MQKEKSSLTYRTDRLPTIYPYHLRSNNRLHIGDLVYYGPTPEYYGVGEILQMEDKICLVDFRGTGILGVHKDAFEAKYLIPIHKHKLSHLLTKR